MKTLRALVLLLVCVLLPFRGAVAATLLCAEAGPSSEFSSPVAHHVHAGLQGESHPHHEAAHAAQGPAQTHASGADDGAQSDSCLVCASACHAAGFITESPSTPGAMPVAAVVFPALQVPAPDFPSEGQDRPPRAL